MRTWTPVVSLCAAALLLGACAHAPAAGTKPPADKVFVTGSHIAQRLDADGRPRTMSAVRVYTREQLAGTGRQGDLGQALRTLDPGLGP
jgi:hypothetical protein